MGVRWLHEVGPAGVAESAVFDSEIAGHVVLVAGDRPGEQANTLEMLANVADQLEQGVIDSAVLRRLFGDLVVIIQSLGIASDQRGAVKAVENFIITPGNASRGSKLSLGNFWSPG